MKVRYNKYFMSNGNLIRDLKKANKVNNKSNSIKNSNNTKKGLKNSTSNDTLNNRVSEANPFLPKKDINSWSTDEGLLYIQSWANDGLTDAEICKKMGIAVTTLWRWCNQEEKIRNAIIRGRDTMTMEVENMMYKCAMGFTYKEQQLTREGDIVEVERYYEPSQEAQKFILTNRRKDKWKSKQEVALEAQVEAQTTIKVSEADKLADSLFGNEDDPEDETVEETESISNV